MSLSNLRFALGRLVASKKIKHYSLRHRTFGARRGTSRKRSLSQRLPSPSNHLPLPSLLPSSSPSRPTVAATTSPHPPLEKEEHHCPFDPSPSDRSSLALHKAPLSQLPLEAAYYTASNTGRPSSHIHHYLLPHSHTAAIVGLNQHPAHCSHSANQLIQCLANAAGSHQGKAWLYLSNHLYPRWSKHYDQTSSYRHIARVKASAVALRPSNDFAFSLHRYGVDHHYTTSAICCFP